MKNKVQPSFQNQLRGFWKSDETAFRVFNTASQTFNNSWRNWKQKFTEFYDDQTSFILFMVVSSFVFSSWIINNKQQLLFDISLHFQIFLTSLRMTNH